MALSHGKCVVRPWCSEVGTCVWCGCVYMTRVCARAAVPTTMGRPKAPAVYVSVHVCTHTPIARERMLGANKNPPFRYPGRNPACRDQHSIA